MFEKALLLGKLVYLVVGLAVVVTVAVICIVLRRPE